MYAFCVIQKTPPVVVDLIQVAHHNLVYFWPRNYAPSTKNSALQDSIPVQIGDQIMRTVAIFTVMADSERCGRGPRRLGVRGVGAPYPVATLDAARTLR